MRVKGAATLEALAKNIDCDPRRQTQTALDKQAVTHKLTKEGKMYRSLKGMMFATVIAAVLTAPEAGAQRTTSSTKGKAPATRERTNKWIFGAHTIASPGVSITGPDFEEWPVSTTMGGGVGVMAGYELNKAITAFASLDLAKQNSGVDWMRGSFGLVHAELGVRANLAQARSQSAPYLTAAIGRRAIGSRITDLDEDEVYDVSFWGTMVSFGGGLQYLLSPKLSLDGGVELGLGTFDHYESDGDLGTVSANTSTTIRVRAGVVWRP